MSFGEKVPKRAFCREHIYDKSCIVWCIATLVVVVHILVGATTASAWDWPWSKKRVSTLTLTGSTTVLPIAQRAAEEFMEAHPEAKITARGGGSGVGIAALIDGTTDIATSSRQMKPNELEAARSKGVNPVEVAIALDGLAIIVHPSNPANDITLDDLRAIYGGTITSWSDIGGFAEPIVTVSRDVASGTFETFKSLVLEGEKTRGDALMLASNKAVATTVAQTPGGIGYVGFGYLSPEVKALSVEGVFPTFNTISSGEYRLSRPLLMYTSEEPSRLAREFMDFLMSATGQEVVNDVGFISVK